MKKLRSLFNKTSSMAKHDALGIYKNVLFVGQQNQFTAELMKSLADSFNLFCVFELEMLVDKSKLALFHPYDPHQPMNPKLIQAAVNELMGGRKRKFDAIVINENLPIPMVTDLSSDEILSRGNLQLMEDTVHKNILAYKLARDHLHSYGSIINVVKHSAFESSSNDTIENCLQNQNLHLSFLLSDLKSLDYQNRINTLLYDDIDAPSEDNKAYRDSVVKALRNWINNKSAPDHNSFVHFKLDPETKRLATLYM
jgi:hypothetical protein